MIVFKYDKSYELIISKSVYLQLWTGKHARINFNKVLRTTTLQYAPKYNAMYGHFNAAYHNSFV